MKRHAFAFPAAAAMLFGVSNGFSASAEGNNAPYQKSCVGIINSFQASKLGLSPREVVAMYPEYFGSVEEYQALQRSCKTALG